jgi:hypothetical protein
MRPKVSETLPKEGTGQRPEPRDNASLSVVISGHGAPPLKLDLTPSTLCLSAPIFSALGQISFVFGLTPCIPPRRPRPARSLPPARQMRLGEWLGAMYADMPTDQRLIV